jgi:hypothetical protein
MSGSMRHDTQDVIEFTVPKSELSKLDSKTFSSADADWSDFVTMNKKLNTAPYLPPDEWMYTFDMVTGPMFGAVRPNGTLKTLPGRGMQTSIHTQEAADLFNRYITKR